VGKEIKKPKSVEIINFQNLHLRKVLLAPFRGGLTIMILFCLIQISSFQPLVWFIRSFLFIVCADSFSFLLFSLGYDSEPEPAVASIVPIRRQGLLQDVSDKVSEGLLLPFS
jgi:hypothetical protein